jgi:hypothetical protein
MEVTPPPSAVKESPSRKRAISVSSTENYDEVIIDEASSTARPPMDLDEEVVVIKKENVTPAIFVIVDEDGSKAPTRRIKTGDEPVFIKEQRSSTHRVLTPRSAIKLSPASSAGRRVKTEIKYEVKAKTKPEIKAEFKEEIKDESESPSRELFVDHQNSQSTPRHPSKRRAIKQETPLIDLISDEDNNPSEPDSDIPIPQGPEHLLEAAKVSVAKKNRRSPVKNPREYFERKYEDGMEKQRGKTRKSRKLTAAEKKFDREVHRNLLAYNTIAEAAAVQNNGPMPDITATTKKGQIDEINKLLANSVPGMGNNELTIAQYKEAAKSFGLNNMKAENGKLLHKEMKTGTFSAPEVF